jgi:hypothetical protein
MIVLAILFIAVGLSGILLRRWLTEVTVNSLPYRISPWKPSRRFYETLALLLGVAYVSVGAAILSAQLV